MSSVSMEITRTQPTIAVPTVWQWLAPVLGMAGAAALMLLPSIGIGAPAAVYAGFSVGLAALYLALVPTCEHGGKAALAMATANAVAGVLLYDWLAALHGWLSLQTVIAALWLLRDQNSGERALAGLLLGLNAGAVAALSFGVHG